MCCALLFALVHADVMAQSLGVSEPNVQVPKDSTRYLPNALPDRIIASPAQDASTGFAVNWRTNDKVRAPALEIVRADDSPAIKLPRVLHASTTAYTLGGLSTHTHRVDIDGLQADTLYMFRVQGEGAWSGWRQLRTAAQAGKPLTLLYFGDTQNKNVSHVGRVVREAMRNAPGALLALQAGDHQSEANIDNEWGEMFEALSDLPAVMLFAPAAGNHEYWEENEDTPQALRVLGDHWRASFALPRNGAGGEHTRETTYWFDAQGVRVVVLDGTSALDLGSIEEQARWLDKVLADNRNPWSIVLIHQPIYSPRSRDAADPLKAKLQPVLERHQVDLVLQGHDHTYGRRSGDRPGQILPQYIVSVTGPKQYRLSDEAKRTMSPWAEDTQLFQVLHIDGQHLRYQARTATGRLYDDFEITRASNGRKTLREYRQGRIAGRNCSHRDATLRGRTDRCWE